MRFDPGPAATTDRTSRRDWIIAWLVALVLHVVAVCGLLWMRMPEAASIVQFPEAIQVDLIAPEESRDFSELPPDRADSRPLHSKLLSNVDSRARDPESGGQRDLPRMRGETDAPLVKLERDQPASRRPVDALPEGIIRVTQDASGSSDIRQPQLESDGNAGLTGDVSLSTLEWDYAPWMERFGRQLMKRWVAPTAYYIGILKEGGWCLLEVEISRSGEILRFELLEEHEHPALTQASQSAVRSLAPMERLPADFPEPTLVLRLRMIYPKIRPR